MNFILSVLVISLIIMQFTCSATKELLISDINDNNRFKVSLRIRKIESVLYFIACTKKDFQ